MAVYLSPIWGAGAQLFDNSGNVLSGGKIYTYAAGTTTPATTYTSSSGITANSNPIILNSAGRVPYEIWLLENTAYKFILKDSTDALIGTWDNIDGVNDINAANVVYDPPFSNSVSTTVANKLSEIVSVKDFGAKGDGSANDTIAIQNAINASVGKTLFFPSGNYRSSDLSVSNNIKFLGEPGTTLFYISGGTTALVSVTGTSTTFESDGIIYDGNYAGQSNTVYSIKFSSAGTTTAASNIRLVNNVFLNGNYADVTIGTSATFPSVVIVEIVNNTFMNGVEGTSTKDVRCLNISSACNINVTGNYFGFGGTPSTYGRAGIVSYISGYSGAASRGNFSNNIFHNMGRSSAASYGVLGALDCYADAVDLTITGNSLINPYGRGIQLKSNASNVIISGNSVDGLIDLTGGVAVDAQITVNRSTTTTVYGNLSIVGNVCRSSGWDGISVSCANVDYSAEAYPIQVIGNSVQNATRRGIGIYNTVHAMVSDNVVDGGCSQYGIYFSGMDGDVSVVGNSVASVTASGIYVGDCTAADFNITANKVADGTYGFYIYKLNTAVISANHSSNHSSYDLYVSQILGGLTTVNNNLFLSTTSFGGTSTNIIFGNNVTSSANVCNNYIPITTYLASQLDFTDTLGNQTVNTYTLPAGTYDIVFEGDCTAAASGGLYLAVASSATVSYMRANSQVWNGTSLVYSTQNLATSGTPAFDMCTYANQVTNYRVTLSITTTTNGAVYMRGGIDINNATPTSIYKLATMKIIKLA